MPSQSDPAFDARRMRQGGSGAAPRDIRKGAARIAFAISLTLFTVWIISDFLAALTWAAVIAIATWPIYLRFADALSRCALQPLAPLLFTVILGFILIIPLMLALQQIAQASDVLVHGITQLRESGIPLPEWIAKLPAVSEPLAFWWETNLADRNAIRTWVPEVNSESVVAWTRVLGGEFLHRLLIFLILLIALFFMFRDGAWLAESVLSTADRVLGGPGERLASKLMDAVRGVMNGTVVVAIVEGGIIGVGYFITGLPNPLLITLLTIAFAMLPMGAEIAAAGAALLLLSTGGSAVAAIGLFSFGLAVTVIGDNLVWPALVGRTTRLPFLLTLIGVLGGMQTFGLIGLFLGPLLMAAMLMVWREWTGPPLTKAHN